MRMGFTEKLTQGTRRTQARSGRCRGLARFDVLVAILLTTLLFVILYGLMLPVHDASRRKAERANCINNLKQIGMDSRVWENDSTPRTSLLETNDQTVGLNIGQIAWINIMGISNIVHSSKILICPADRETPTTTDATGNKIRISYFLNLDANEGYPQQMLSGDDNLVANGVPVKPGIWEVYSNTRFSWTAHRHRYAGNIGLADGSVGEESSLALQNAAAYSTNGVPLFTNRFAIP